MPQSIVVSPAVFAHSVIPAHARRERGARRRGQEPALEEVDVLVERARLHSAPAAAHAQTRAVARSDPAHRSPAGLPHRQRLEHAHGRERGRRGRQADVLLPRTARRSSWRLCLRPTPAACSPRHSGASRPCSACAARTAAISCASSATGRSPLRARDRRSAWSAGFLCALAILGSGALRQAAPGDLARSALIALAGGMLVTALALVHPGTSRARAGRSAGNGASWRSRQPPAWRRLWLDVAPARRGRCRRGRRPAHGSARLAARLRVRGPVRLAALVPLARAAARRGRRRAARGPGPARDRAARCPSRPRRDRDRARCSAACDGGRGSSARASSRSGSWSRSGRACAPSPPPTTPRRAPTRASSWAPISASRRAPRARTAAICVAVARGGVSAASPRSCRGSGTRWRSAPTGARGRTWRRSTPRRSAGRRG